MVKSKPHRNFNYVFVGRPAMFAVRILILCAIISFTLFLFIGAPLSFPVGTVIEIPEGVNGSEVAGILASRHVVRSEFIFRLALRLTGASSHIVAGDYYFEEKLSLPFVINRLRVGAYGLTPLRIRIPEGATSFDIAELMVERFSRFDAEDFLKRALPEEGYLFPDTYFFLPNVRAVEVVRVMKKTFWDHIEEIWETIDASPHTLHDIVIMASLLEKEAHVSQTRRIISGILWNRIEIGMPLQVDAVFPYIIGKNTYEVTLDDLDVDSPYNTYKYAGLPIAPIANPSLDALTAAASPIESNYFFYLSDRFGNTYYAETFEGHKRNRTLHLN